jgi:hypothetical protein
MDDAGGIVVIVVTMNQVRLKGTDGLVHLPHDTGVDQLVPIDVSYFVGQSLPGKWFIATGKEFYLVPPLPGAFDQIFSKSFGATDVTADVIVNQYLHANEILTLREPPPQQLGVKTTKKLAVYSRQLAATYWPKVLPTAY